MLICKVKSLRHGKLLQNVESKAGVRVNQVRVNTLRQLIAMIISAGLER